MVVRPPRPDPQAVSTPRVSSATKVLCKVQILHIIKLLRKKILRMYFFFISKKILINQHCCHSYYRFTLMFDIPHSGHLATKFITNLNLQTLIIIINTS